MTSWKKICVCGFAGAVGLAAVAATDGTWASSTSGGSWSDTANWVDGILPADGGVARFNFTKANFHIDATGQEVTLGGFALSNTVVRDTVVFFSGGTFNLVPPARIDQPIGSFVMDGKVVCDGDIVFNGNPDNDSRFLIRGNQSIAGRTIISNMYVRIGQDTSLGPTPETLRSDAVVLAGGALQNGAALVSVSATRGITLTEDGGYLMAGFYAPAYLKVLSPITGPGWLGITYENSPVVLANPANDWSGDTRVGVFGPGWTGSCSQFWLQLGADEVIPHGDGKGQLYVGPCQTFCNTMAVADSPMAQNATLEMSGHTETVNALQGGVRAILDSTNGASRLILASDADSNFRGTVRADVTVEKNGSGTLYLNGGTLMGGVDLVEGTLVVGAGNVAEGATVNLLGGTVSIVPSGGCCEWFASSDSSSESFTSWRQYPFYGRSASWLSGLARARYRSRWYVAEAGTYSFRSSYGGRSVLWIDGTEVISNQDVRATAKVVQDVSVAAGWHDVELLFERTSSDTAYGNSLASGIMYDSQNGDFSTDENLLRARPFADEDGTNVVASGYVLPQMGHFHVGADTTFTVSEAAEPYVFGGVLTTDADNPHTLTINTASGSPVMIGSDTESSPALISTNVILQSAGGLVLTNNVVLQESLGSGVTVAEGATVVYDYADAISGTVTLSDNDLHVISEGTGDGTIVVPTGRKVIFDTISLSDGTFVDPDTGTRTYANAVVLQGGTLEFAGAGTITFTGAVSGYGSVTKTGSGSVVLSNAAGLTSEATVYIYKGLFCVPAGANLGSATIETYNGRLANVEGEQVTISNPVNANSGGIEVLGADGVIELTGAITHYRNISKWGEGTLILSGAEASDLRIHVRGGTLVCAKDAGIPAFQNIIGCEAGSTIRIDGDGQVRADSIITLGGGTLDVNGHDLTLLSVSAPSGGTLVNNGSSAATVTLLSGNDSSFKGILAEGTAPLTLFKAGGGTYDLSDAAIGNSALTATNGTVCFTGPETASGSLLRFLPTASRPAAMGNPTWGTNGIQIAEFRVLLNGTAVAWPEGTTAYASRPGATSKESAAKAIDGSNGTKWYANDSSAFHPLIIDCGEDIEFDAYQIQTANDAIGRDPVAWTVSVGSVSGGVTNWVVIDTQEDALDLVSTNRYTWTDAFSVLKSMRHAVLPSGYALTVNAPATAEFALAGQVFDNLAGDGMLVFTDGTAATIGGASSFTGSVSSEEPVRLAYSTATVPCVTAADTNTVIVNDGADATLVFPSGERTQVGAWQDGNGTLGLEVQSGAVLNMKGLDNAYTGATTVRSGGEIRVAPGIAARYIRYTIVNCTANQGAKNAQLSEIQLMRMGEGIAWPEGTTATTSGANAQKNEGAAQLIDGTVNTKCYWGGATWPVLITLPETISFDGYRWYTANDSMTARNPVSWRLETSLDGVTWTLVDEQTDRTTVTTTKTLAYTYLAADDMDSAFDAVGDGSPITLEASGICSVAYVEETIGGLSGAGALAVLADACVRLNATTDSSFAGTVSGTGTLAKAGSAIQVLGGAVNLTGTIVVENGILDLTGATLTGVTNIVLRGGALIGTATVNGDLTVTSSGGMYGASLAVTGTLKLDGTPAIYTGFAGESLSRTAFTYGATDAASIAAFQAAACSESLARRWKFAAKASATSMSWSITPGGTYIMLR